MRIINQVATFIQKYQLLSKDGLHLVALSGGADSVALLRILLSLGYHVEVAHCNFRLRGEESDRDEQFAASLCQQLQVPFHVVHFDTHTYASVHKVSIEMAARELRYGYFRQLKNDIGAERICVAHHRDDAVETFLMNLLRGSGIHGLVGIRPINGDVVRPLLCVSRTDIEKYLHSIGQTFVVDSTNLVDDVLRNKIRIRLIPLLKELNPAASDNIALTTSYMQEAEKMVNDTVTSILESLVQKEVANKREILDIDALKKTPSPELILHEWLSPFGFNASQTEDILVCLEGTSGRLFQSEKYIIIIDRNRLILEPRVEPTNSVVIPEEGCYVLKENLKLDVNHINDISISKSRYCATLDKVKVKFPLTIRLVKEGDVFCPFGMKGHRLVSDFLTDQKLSLLDKRRQLVVTDAEGEIIWLVGLRTDNRFGVTSQTQSVLRLSLKES